MNVEVASSNNIIIYVKGGILPLTLDEIQRRLEGIQLDEFKHAENLELIRRPLYGLKAVKNVKEGIIEFVQMMGTQVFRDYYFAELQKGCRIYIEEHSDGVNVFMASAKRGQCLNDFIRLTRV